MGGPGGPGQVNLAEYMSQELGDREWVEEREFLPGFIPAPRPAELALFSREEPERPGRG